MYSDIKMQEKKPDMDVVFPPKVTHLQVLFVLGQFTSPQECLCFVCTDILCARVSVVVSSLLDISFVLGTGGPQCRCSFVCKMVWAYAQSSKV